MSNDGLKRWNEMTTAQRMAIAVLLGDDEAALPLADLLQETEGGEQVLPSRKVTCSRDRLRCLVYIEDNTPGLSEEDVQRVQREVTNWLDQGQLPLLLSGIDRIDLFEMPEGETSPGTENILQDLDMAEGLVCELRSVFASMPASFADVVGRDLARRVNGFLSRHDDEE